MYAWGLPRDKRTRRHRSLYVHCNHLLLQLKRAPPWDALLRSCGVIGSRPGKNTDGRTGLPWDVALYVPSGGVHAGEAPRRARDGSVCVGECGGPGVHWPPGRPQSPDPGAFQIARAYAALGAAGSRRSMRCCSRWPKTVALPMQASCGPIPRRRSYLLGIQPTRDLRGWAQRCGRAVASSKPGRWWEWIRPWHRCRRSSGQSKNTTSLPRANRPSARCDAFITEVGQLIVQTRLLVQGLGARPDRVTQHALTICITSTRWPSGSSTDRAVDHHWRSGQGQNPPCGCDAGAGAGAPKAGKEASLVSVSSESPRWGLCVWDVDPWGGGRMKMSLQALAGYREILVHTPFPH